MSSRSTHRAAVTDSIVSSWRVSNNSGRLLSSALPPWSSPPSFHFSAAHTSPFTEGAASPCTVEGRSLCAISLNQSGVLLCWKVCAERHIFHFVLFLNVLLVQQNTEQIKQTTHKSLNIVFNNLFYFTIHTWIITDAHKAQINTQTHTPVCKGVISASQPLWTKTYSWITSLIISWWLTGSFYSLWSVSVHHCWLRRSLFWGTGVCHADESVDEASGAGWGAWVELFLQCFSAWYFSDTQVKQNVRWQDSKWCKMTRQVWVWRGSGWSCLLLNAVTVLLYFFFRTQSGKHESWFSHCGWFRVWRWLQNNTIDSHSFVSSVGRMYFVLGGLSSGCPVISYLSDFAASAGDCLTLLSQTQSDLGSVRHSHPQDDFRWSQQPKERCKLLSERAQSSTREPEPPHYSLNCGAVGCRHTEDIHTVNVCSSAGQFSCKLTITSLQLHLHDLILHNDRFVRGIHAVLLSPLATISI